MTTTNNTCELLGVNVGINKDKIRQLIDEMLAENSASENALGEDRVKELIAEALAGYSGGGTPVQVDGPSYSFEEQWSGKYWVDGKKIYQKTIDFGALLNSTTKFVEHGIENLDFVVDHEGATRETVGLIFSLPHVSSAGTGDICVYFDNAKVTIVSRSDRRGFVRTFVTMWYTCTDR